MTDPGKLPDLVAALADTIDRTGGSSGPDNRPPDGAVMRFGTVTAVVAGKAQTDATGAAKVTATAGYTPNVGDVVCIITQGPVAHIIGKVGGSSAPPVGVIHPYAGSVAPPGWVLCNGQTLLRADYPALFAVCGTTYGAGDGSTTFNVPNLTDRTPVGTGSLFTRGETGGNKTVTLSTAQLPSHSHSINHGHSTNSHSHSYSGAGSTAVQSGSGATVADDSGGNTGGTTVTVNNHSGSSGSTGSGNPVDVMSPYLGVVYILRALP